MPPRRNTRANQQDPPEGQQDPPNVGQIDLVLVQLFQTLTQQTAALAQQQVQLQQQLLAQQQQRQAPQATTFKSFQSVQPPEFKGTHDPVGAQTWIKESEKAIALARIPEDKKIEYASYYLKNGANFWCESARAIEPKGVITWDRFKELFKEKYLPT